MKKYKTTPFEFYGVVQKEYVTVADSLLANTGQLKKYFELSLRYVQTLTPKQSKKGASLPPIEGGDRILAQSRPV